MHKSITKFILSTYKGNGEYLMTAPHLAMFLRNYSHLTTVIRQYREGKKKGVFMCKITFAPEFIAMAEVIKQRHIVKPL